MKKTIFKPLFFLLLLISTATKAQDINNNPANLGILCYIHIDPNNDPTERGYAKYPISQPSEGFGYYGEDGPPPMGILYCMGPGRTFIDLLDYSNPILNVYIRDLELIADNSQYVYLDVPVKTFVYNLGISGSERVQAYYSIVLVLPH